MTNVRRKKIGEEPTQSKQKMNYVLVAPLIFVMCILPFLIRECASHTELTKNQWFPDLDKVYDMYLCYKQWFLVGIAGIMLFVLVCKFIFHKESMKFVSIFIPLLVFGGLELLSSIASAHVSYTQSGGYEQFENVFALIAYSVLVLYAFYIIQYESDLKVIVRIFVVSILLLSILGISQITSHDFLRMDAIKKLYLSKATIANPDTFSFTFEKNRVYLTLYNPNYVGVYAALVIPILLCLVYFSKKVWHTAVYLLAMCGMGVCLIGSKSKAGVISVVVAVIVALVFLRKQIIKKWYITLIGIVGVIAMIMALILPTSPFYSAELTGLGKKGTEVEQKENQLESVTTNKDNVTISCNGHQLKISMVVKDKAYQSFVFKDESDKKITKIKKNADSTGYVITDSRFPQYEIMPVIMGDTLGFKVNMEKGTWYFTNTLEKGKYIYINPQGKIDEIKNASTAVFTNYQSLATDRGYIWARTMPLLKDHIFLGSGADTFVYEFPQNDYVGSYNHGMYGQIVTKPHSMYLKIAVESGMVSMIAFLAFYILYFISCVKIYFRNPFEDFTSCLGAAIFIGTISYMIVGLTNDSTICVAPVFWALIGIGVTINFKFYEHVKENKADIQK